MSVLRIAPIREYNRSCGGTHVPFPLPKDSYSSEEHFWGGFMSQMRKYE